MTVQIIVGYLRLIQRVLQQEQIDLHQIGVPDVLIQQFHAYLLNEQSHQFDLAQYAQLLQHLQTQFDRPISLVLAERVALQDIGLVGYLASTSLDLQHALQLFGQYYPLLYKQTNTEPLNILQENHYIKIYWRGLCEEWKIFYELNLALLFKIASMLVQVDLMPPTHLTLGYTPQLALSYYQQFFNCSVQVEPKQYSIQFPKQVLAVRSMAADSQLNQMFSKQAENSLATSNPALQQQQFKHKITTLIEQGLLHQDRLQRYIATQLHCSERTLQRQLKHYSLHFQDIVDEYRLQKSMQYLQQGKSFTDIAELLAYADQSAFSRAFKRWTGKTPKQFLKENSQSAFDQDA
ncbi:MAG: AraC family transcriptional regulator [Acinetobacter populi]|jgi:AraC-like DNA-binding protein|uniref:helix-turn-helix transcriptional regulator n=1 Tax=Acinetobacter populi TaxID=1582270 RepID=UPI0023552F40|nr:AraC family transcriptional regulator [Acinetobacter populi]MCH4246902.1 AraC family transcriptional regulator [Acinetobacter populi]